MTDSMGKSGPQVDAGSTPARAAVEAGAVLIDLRAPDIFADGHVRGAVNIPAWELPGRLHELLSSVVVVYGDEGESAARLRDLGYAVLDAGPAPFE